MKTRIGEWIYWTPRIMGVVFILFLMLFSLDVFEQGMTVGQIAIGLFMHNIPALVLALLLSISWKHEIVGSFTFIGAGLLYIALLAMNPTFEWYMVSWALVIAGPALLIGALFLIGWFHKKTILKEKRT